MEFQIKRASRQAVKFKMAITGPSGSGKTYSALKIAKGLQDCAAKDSKTWKIGYIDTENGSASLYADKPGMPQFDVIELAPPFHTDRYLAAADFLIKHGVDILIIDSLSHQWMGEGGILERKEKLDSRPGANSWANWAKFTPEHERIKSFILQSPVHLIVCMRSKQEYTQTEENGKKKIQKMGAAPVQREGMEFEFSLSLDLAMNHEVEVSKDRTELFDGQYFKPSEKTGEIIYNWLKGAKTTGAEVLATATAPEVRDSFNNFEEQPLPKPAPKPEYKPAKLDLLQAAMKGSKFDWKGKVSMFAEKALKKSLAEITEQECNDLCVRIRTSDFETALSNYEKDKQGDFEKAMNEGDSAL